MSINIHRVVEILNSQLAIVTKIGFALSPKEVYNLQYQRLRLLEHLPENARTLQPKFLNAVTDEISHHPCTVAYHDFITRQNRDYYDYPLIERLDTNKENMQLRLILNSHYIESTKQWFKDNAQNDNSFPYLRQQKLF